jgi:hypothetical protein
VAQSVDLEFKPQYHTKKLVSGYKIGIIPAPPQRIYRDEIGE